MHAPIGVKDLMWLDIIHIVEPIWRCSTSHVLLLSDTDEREYYNSAEQVVPSGRPQKQRSEHKSSSVTRVSDVTPAVSATPYSGEWVHFVWCLCDMMVHSCHFLNLELSLQSTWCSWLQYILNALMLLGFDTCYILMLGVTCDVNFNWSSSDTLHVCAQKPVCHTWCTTQRQIDKYNGQSSDKIQA